MTQKSLLRKKKLTYAIIGTFFFLGGVEYAVILPTLWLYIQKKYGAEEYFLGLTLSAFSLSASVAGPVMGRLADKYRMPKFLMIAGAVWEIAGNIMYFLGFSKWFIFGGRLIAGVGAGAESVLVAEISRVVPDEERTGIISILIAVRQIGLLIGPGLNLFLRLANFEIGTITVNKYNVPGAFMACLWLMVCVLTICLYHDLHVIMLKLKVSGPESEPEQVNQKCEIVDKSVSVTPPNPRTKQNDTDNKYSTSNGSLVRTPQSRCKNPLLTVDSYHTPAGSFGSTNYGSIVSSDKNSFKDCNINADSTFEGDYETPVSFNASDESDDENFYLIQHTSTEIMETAEKLIANGSNDPCLLSRSVSSNLDSRHASLHSNQDNTQTDGKGYADEKMEKITLRFMYNEYIREEVITILILQFNSFFNQVALETMLTPITNSLLKWGELENSIIYCAVGVEVICVFLLVRWLSRHIDDRHMILFGVCVLTVATSWLTYSIPSSSTDVQWVKITKLSVGLVLDAAALPFLVACSISLYSKITRKENQGLSHGLRRSFVGFGTILGPLWAGSMLSRPYIMFGVMLALLFISLVTILLSYKKLCPLPTSCSTVDVPQPETITDSEKQPLLQPQE